VKASEIKHGRKYCSLICRNEAKRNQVDCVCEQCGKSFQIDSAQVKHGVGKYCSRQCHGIGQRRQVDCICKECEKSFQVSFAVVKRGGGKYCSKTCMGLSKRGEKHYLWRGGQSKYRGPNWTQQRKLAYNRDNGECKYCGKKPKAGERKFQVHHIKPFRAFDGDYLTANQLTNLITLCQLCHRKAERGQIVIQPYLF
jgi:5-methylcytosine-specific restriction endonuclease McrA